MVHIVQLKDRKQKPFGKAKNGSIWMHNHQAWTAEQLKKLVAQASEACKEREVKVFFATGDTPQRYIDIDRKHWTKVRSAS